MFKLTAEQEAIKEATIAGGNLVIDAKAGCGKSSTARNVIILQLTTRENVLFGQFGTRIKDENVAEIALLKGIKCNLDTRTFHSLGCKFLFQNWKGGKMNNFREENIAERLIGGDRKRFAPVAKNVGKLAELAKGSAPFAKFEDMEELLWNFELYGEDLEELGFSPEEVCELALRVLEESKKKDGTYSFSDMIWLPLVMNWTRKLFDTIIIDEAQDLNKSQILLAQVCLKNGGRQIVIGDPFQAIYSWRGADSFSIQRMREELENVKDLTLSVTFRCGKKIVELAQKFVPEYTAHESNCEGLIDDISLDKIFEEAKIGDAILSRKNAPLTSLCLGFLKRGIRAHIEGKDFGKTLVNLVDKIAGRRNSIPEFLSRLQAYQDRQERRIKAQERKGEEKFLNELWDRVECLRVLAEELASVSELKERIKKLFEDGEKAGRKGKIILSSIHRAKGLEFDRVFGLDWTLNRNRDQEEKNLEYVLITRAKKHLTWVHEV